MPNKGVREERARLVRDVHEQGSEREEQRHGCAEHEGDDDNLEDELVAEGEVYVRVHLVQPVHLRLRRRFRREDVTVDELLGPHELNYAGDHGEVAEDSVQEDERARRVPVGHADAAHAGGEHVAARPSGAREVAPDTLRRRYDARRRGRRRSEEEEDERGDRCVEHLRRDAADRQRQGSPARRRASHVESPAERPIGR